MTGAQEKSSKKMSKWLGRNNSRRLVEYFVVVSSVSQNLDDIIVKGENDQSTDVTKLVEKALNFEAVITARYPTNDHEKNPLLHESVVSFCHPSDEIVVKDRFELPKVSLKEVTQATTPSLMYYFLNHKILNDAFVHFCCLLDTLFRYHWR